MIDTSVASKKIFDFFKSLGNENASRSLDDILGKDFRLVGGLGIWCIDLFPKVVHYFRSSGDDRTICMVIPVSFSEFIKIDKELVIQNIENSLYPPRIGVLASDNVFAAAYEEYRNVLPLPKGDYDMGATFRSWRDERHTLHGWEYSNDVYIWALRRVPHCPMR